MIPDAPHDETALRMQPLLKRGRQALFAYLRTFPKERRPIGGGQIHVVTRSDFVANADLCLSHVELNGTPTHVLCANGALCVLIEKREQNW